MKILSRSDKGFLLPAPPLPRAGRRIQSDSAILFIYIFWRCRVLATPYSYAPYTDFHDQYVKWRHFAQRMCLLRSRKQNFTFRPHFPPKRKFLAIFDKTKFRVEKVLTMAMLTCKLHLIVNVALWKLYSEQANRGQGIQIWDHRRPAIYRWCIGHVTYFLNFGTPPHLGNGWS